MEGLEILISPDVIDHLDQLIFKLYENKYFSCLENAEKYVVNLYDSIRVSIKTQRHFSTPKALISYGEFYISFQSYKRRTWYIFFSKKDNRILVKHIMNNHVADASLLEHL